MSLFVAALVVLLVAARSWPRDEPADTSAPRVVADWGFTAWAIDGLGNSSQWLDRDGCDDVAKLFGGTVWTIDDLDLELTTDEVEQRFERQRQNRQTVLAGPIGQELPELAWVFEAETLWRDNVLATYDVFGRELGATTQHAFANPWVDAFPEGATMSDGSTLTLDEFGEATVAADAALYDACSNPPADFPQPVDDPALELPLGTLIYRPTERGSLRAVRLHGLGSSAPWGEPEWGTPRVSPSGQEVLVNVEDNHVYAVATARGELIQAVESHRHLSCVSWARSGPWPFIAASTSFEPGTVRVIRILTDPDVSPDFFVPDDFSCPTDLVDHVAFLGSENGGHGIWMTDKFGMNLEQVFAPQGCIAVLAGAAPDGERLLANVACGDRYQSGLYVIDVRDQSIQHLVAGAVAVPQFSADGEWLVFGYVPPVWSDYRVDTWIMRSDGSEARKLVEHATFPALILDADLDEDVEAW